MSDQDVQGRIARLKLSREVLKRFSELLEKKPELRAKSLSRINPAGGGVFRDVLSGLRNQQLFLAEINKKLLFEDVTLETLSNILQKRLIDFSSQTTNVVGNALIWIPEEASVEQSQKLTKVFSAISNIAAKLAETPTENAMELKSGFEKLMKAREDAKELLTDTDIASLDAEYTDIRLSDILSMDLSIQSNMSLLEHLSHKDYEAFVLYLQKELNAETSNIALNLSAGLAKISGLSNKTDVTIEQLSELVEVDLLNAQKQVLLHAQVPWAKNAISHQEEAAKILKNIVALLDVAIVEFVKAKNSQEQAALKEGAEAAKDPTEDQIRAGLMESLAVLEKEMRQPTEKKMSFGIVEKDNIKVQSDWEMGQSGKKDGQSKPESEQSEEEKNKQPSEMQQAAKEQEQNRREMQQAQKSQQQQAKASQRLAAEAQNVASQNRKDISERLHKNIAIPWAKGKNEIYGGGETWNKLSSKLRQNLNQDVESNIPEVHREAIEQYFREIAKEKVVK